METVQLNTSRWGLLRIWVTGFVTIFSFTIFICVTRFRDPEDWSKIIGWVMPHLLPTLSLIVTVIGADAINPSGDQTRVRKTFHELARNVSITYLVLVFATFLLEGRLHLDLFQTMGVANLWLGPLQGIVAGTLSVLFFTKPDANLGPIQEEATERGQQPSSNSRRSSNQSAQSAIQRVDPADDEPGRGRTASGDTSPLHEEPATVECRPRRAPRRVQ